jgi:hypothetical protein
MSAISRRADRRGSRPLWPCPPFRLSPVRLKNAAAVTLFVVLGVAASGAAAQSGGGWQRNASDPRWVQGQIDLATPAATVWQRVAQVREWPSIFSDLASFSVKSESRDGARWTIRFESRMLGHGQFDYFVSLDAANQSGLAVLSAPGVRAAASVTVVPIDDRRSRVLFAAFVDRYGVLGWFLSEQSLRWRQERLVEQNLGDLGRAFGPAGGLP